MTAIVVPAPTGGTGSGATGPTGPTGPAGSGSDGATWLSGSGTPTDAIGRNDDLYLDTSNGNVWRKDAGTWGA